jgi:hypothetical protein
LEIQNRMPETNVFSKLYGRVGRYSRYAGIGFIVLSVFFLVIAVSNQFIVFEIDSIVAFLAAIVLLFKDPRARVQARVFDAVLGSTDEAIGELSASDVGFTYVPTGDSVEMVVIIPELAKGAAQPKDAPSKAPPVEAITPPGRGLAKLYVRETGAKQLTMDVLRASLPEAMRENFGLARSVDIVSKDEGVDVTLHGASTTCTCGIGQKEPASRGSVGCGIASFLAVLVSAATNRQVLLERCVREADTGAWTIPMRFGPTVLVSA